MCFGPISRVPLSAIVSDSTSNPTNKNESGSVYSTSDIGAYRKNTENSLKEYASMGAQQKTTAPTSEYIGIKGAVSVPGAASYTDAKLGVSEIAAKSGDLAAAASNQNIELCGFLSNIPSIDIDLSAHQLGIPELQDIVKAINGVTLPVMEFGSDAIVNAVGGVTKAAGELASAIQASIPQITCGAKPISPVALATGFGSALVPGGPLVAAVAPTMLDQVGITPPINISSPDVTVQSLNDVLEAGEF